MATADPAVLDDFLEKFKNQVDAGFGLIQGDVGAVLATLEVRRSNAPAIALYSSLGYRQVGLRPRYYQPDGEDAFVMLKELRDQPPAP